jgi:alpha-beta hydrolase superfamily lysophospholipase
VGKGHECRQGGINQAAVAAMKGALSLTAIIMASNSTTFVMTLFGFLGVPILGAYFFQNALIYHPDNTSLTQLIHQVKDSPMTLWPAANEDYRGLIALPRPEETRGTIVVFHGNAGSATDRLYYVSALEPLGYRVLLAEYPKYGARGGSLGEQSLVSDAVGTVEAVRQQFKGPLYVWGESLGCGVATGVASEKSLAVDGLILITPWNNLPDLAQSIYWFLPAKWLVKDRFDNAANLKEFKRPVAVVMADTDEIIPNKQTMAFYEAISCPKRLWVFKNSGHNSWPVSPAEKWWREVIEFTSSS